MTRLLWISLGGALGTAARYLVGTGAAKLFGAGYPVGTMVVNLLGSFLLGFLLAVAPRSASLSPTLRLALSVGFLGGFTTYSSFNQETLQMFHNGTGGQALIYLSATLLGCLIAGWLGMSLGIRFATD